MSKIYVIRTVVTGIICYFLLAFIFPNMSIFVEMLIVAVSFLPSSGSFPVSDVSFQDRIAIDLVLKIKS